MDENKADLKNGYTQIANKIFEALYKCPVLNRETRVLMFIIYQTYGYHHKDRALSNSYISQGVGIAPQHVCKIIQKLVDQKIIKKRFEEGNKIQILGINKKVSEWCAITKSGITKNGNTPYYQNWECAITKSGNENNIDKNKIECVGENGKSRFPDTKIFDRLWTEWSYSQAGKDRVSRKTREEISDIGYARMNDARLRYEQDLNTRTTKNNQPLSARTWFGGGFRQYLPEIQKNGIWRSITGKAYFGEERLD